MNTVRDRERERDPYKRSTGLARGGTNMFFSIYSKRKTTGERNFIKKIIYIWEVLFSRKTKDLWALNVTSEIELCSLFTTKILRLQAFTRRRPTAMNNEVSVRKSSPLTWARYCPRSLRNDSSSSKQSRCCVVSVAYVCQRWFHRAPGREDWNDQHRPTRRRGRDWRKNEDASRQTCREPALVKANRSFLVEVELNGAFFWWKSIGSHERLASYVPGPGKSAFFGSKPGNSMEMRSEGFRGKRVSLLNVPFLFFSSWRAKDIESGKSFDGKSGERSQVSIDA